MNRVVQQTRTIKSLAFNKYSSNSGNSVIAITLIPAHHPERYVKVSNHWLSSFLGTYSQYSGTVRQTMIREARKKELEKKWFTNWVILPSAWLRIWEVSLSYTRTAFGSEYLLKPIRVVADDSPIFQACIEGNIKRINLLLNNSSTTLHDTSTWGWTLLYVSYPAPLCPNSTVMRVFIY
jgi:hypothetical protein